MVRVPADNAGTNAGAEVPRPHLLPEAAATAVGGAVGAVQAAQAVLPARGAARLPTAAGKAAAADARPVSDLEVDAVSVAAAGYREGRRLTIDRPGSEGATAGISGRRASRCGEREAGPPLGADRAVGGGDEARLAPAQLDGVRGFAAQ